MFLPNHPTEILSSLVIQAIRNHTLEAEKQEALTQQQLQIIYEHDWFRLFVPRSLGGLEMPLPNALQILEATAYADGSFGWALNLGAGAGLFAAYLDPALSKTVFQNVHACVAGSGAITGTAEDHGEFYIVNGQWQYASGSSHATMFSANCTIQSSQAYSAQPDQNSTPTFRSFLFFPDEIILKRSWNAYGLKATASHDFEIKGIKVPKTRVFNLLEPAPYEQGKLYQFPFLQFAEITITLQTSGIALHFMDEFQKLLLHKKGMQGEFLKDHHKVKDTLALAEAKLASARTWLYALVKEAWLVCETGTPLSKDLLRKVSLASRYLAQSARESTGLLYPLAGMSALSPESQLNTAWRDLHTATQHILASPLGFAEQSQLC